MELLTQETLEFLRESVCSLVEVCADVDLLDLICKLLLPTDL